MVRAEKLQESWLAIHRLQDRILRSPDFALTKPSSRLDRYSDIRPYEWNKVTLSGSSPTYVNASRVSDVVPGSRRVYIATQGPLHETIKDFWQMVWQEGADTIVMLTALTDPDGRDKCVCYWPRSIEREAMPVQGSDLSLRLTKQKQQGHGMIVREMELGTRGTHRSVRQVHVPYWADHAALNAEQDLLEVCEAVRLLDPQNALVVHCSAGCGRTGTFIAALELVETGLDTLRETLGRDPVLAIVSRLRRQRVAMVQTRAQLELLYKLYEHKVAAEGEEE